jgi:hypothetical protein
MKWEISRTSQPIYDEGSPCPEAVQEYVGGKKRWFIVFNTLDDLMKFVIKNECIVLTGAEIEIYDEERE